MADCQWYQVFMQDFMPDLVCAGVVTHKVQLFFLYIYRFVYEIMFVQVETRN